MVNDPELNGKYLGTISSQFIKVADQLKEVSYLLRDRKITDYPIFPICKVKQAVGALLIDKDIQIEHGLEWHIYVSFLKEFQQRGLVMPESLELFLANYKPVDEFCCLFVIEPDFTNYVFIPYPED